MSVAEPPPAGEERWALREAAAVRWTFADPDVLVASVAPASDARADVLDDAQLVESPDGRTAWMLSDEVRAAALRRLASTGRLDGVLGDNVDPDDSMQVALKAIAGGGVSLERLSFDELTQVLKLCEWFGDTLPGAPAVAAVEQQLARTELLAPLRALTGEGFHGRADILARLEDHVFTRPSLIEGKSVPGIAGSFRRGVGQLLFALRDRSRPPLLIHAPGGSGKSTVLAQFLLSHGSEGLVFAHIDFDRPRLDPHEPLTLLAEIVRQISIQLPELAEPLGAVQSAAAEALHASVAVKRGAGGGDGLPVVSYAERSGYIDELGRVLRAKLPRGGVFVLAIDTLEAVQYRGQDYVDELWYFLGQLQRAMPGLRVIAAGRTELPGVQTVDIALADLDAASAREFLVARLAGVVHSPDDPIIETILSAFPRSPLTLKLAADVVRDAGEEALGDVFGRRGLRRKVEADEVQGILYRRIIDHLHDEDVKRLAVPGLALRRITPDVIQHVLAEPSGVAVDGPAAAADLFTRFAHEVALVDVARDGSLRFRADVRRLALRLVAKDRSLTIAEIDQRAVAFYESRDGEQDRAEELYHRLRLGQPRKQLDERWTPGLGELLGDALEDLEPAQQAYLATKIGRTLTSETLKHADQEDWERHVDQRARYFYELRDYDRARQLLNERSERLKGSPLPLLEAEVLEALGKRKAAAKVLEAALAEADDEHDSQRVLDTALASARIRGSLHEVKRPQRDLDRAAAIARQLDDPPAQLRVRIAASELGIKPAGTLPSAAEIVARADGLHRDPRLLMSAAARFGADEPYVLERTLQLVGLPGIRWLDVTGYSARFAEATGEPQAQWNAAISKHRRNPSAVAALFLERTLTPELAAALAQTYSDLLERAPAAWPAADAGDAGRRGPAPVPAWANPQKRQTSSRGAA
jgi:hypothetical protein